jgi:N utilization substance protein A
VRLASQLTRYDIDILTEAGESERRQEDFGKRSALFVEALDVDDMIAGLLVTEGYSTIEEIIDVDDEELAGIEGFDEAIATELKRRGMAFLEQKEAEAEEKRVEIGVEDAVADLGAFTGAMLVKLGEAGIKTLDDLADLASDELIEILGEDAMDEEQANAVIMAARAHWFGDEVAQDA